MISTKISEVYTRPALDTFVRFTDLHPEDRFLLIDNDSSLDPSSLPAANELIQREAPHSFAANANLFAQRALDEGKDLMLMNNDLIFAPDWLPALCRDDAALYFPVCNMQMQYQSGAFKFAVKMSMSDYEGREAEFLGIVAQHKRTAEGYRLYHSIPYYCVRIPQPILKRIGLFDEAYQPYGWEDTDYTLRCYLQGIPLYFAMQSLIIHFYGKSTWSKDEGVASAQVPDSGGQSQALFVRKWGKELALLFGFHTPEMLAGLKMAEEKAVIKLYGEIVRSGRLEL